MALRGKTPDKIEKRLKMLLFGPAGAGKTTAAIQFPKPYLIDTERGAENAQYVEHLRRVGGAYFSSSDPDEVLAEVTSLLSEKHDYRTVIIDPLTVLYNDLLDKAADEVGTDFGKHKGPADRKIKRLITMLLRLDMNVIITSHEKPKWVRTKDAKGKDTVAEDGATFDCYGRIDYVFDLLLQIQRRGKERFAVVRKSRLLGFTEGDGFEFSYDAIAERYGREVIEKASTPEVLASPEQVRELERLLGVLKLPEATTDKWLEKAQADNWTEMPEKAIQACIDHCKRQIQPEGSKP
jgi:hypothetical protein